MIYSPAHFIQVLEGERDAVEATLERIRRDPRHTNLQVIDARDVDSREFGEWAMTARLVRDLQTSDAFGLDARTALDLLRRVRA